MANTKTYKSSSRNLVLFLTVRGRVRCIRFSDMGATYKYSLFTTDDAKTQEALENSKKFNKEFFLLKSSEQEKKPTIGEEGPETVAQQPKRKIEASYPKVKRVQEAVAILEEKYGVEPGTLSKKADVLRVANQYNIEFPDLK